MIIWILSGTPILAQSELRIGLSTGYNRSNTSLFLVPLSDGTIHQRMYSGVYAAIDLERNLKEWLYISSGLEYIQHGTHFDQIQRDRINNYTNLMHYLRVPLTATISMDLPGINLFFKGGPYLAYAPTLTQYTFIDNFTSIKENKNPDDLGVRQWDIGAIVGLGFFKKFNEKYKATLTYSWNIGMRDIDKDPSRKTFTESSSLALSVLRHL